MIEKMDLTPWLETRMGGDILARPYDNFGTWENLYLGISGFIGSEEEHKIFLRIREILENDNTAYGMTNSREFIADALRHYFRDDSPTELQRVVGRWAEDWLS